MQRPLTALVVALSLVLGAQVSAAGAADSWDTFLGGTGADHGNGIAVTVDGRAYITGSSTSAWGDPRNPFPDPSYFGDSFIAEIDASGALLWHAFMNWEPGSNWASDVAVDGGGNVYVTGRAAGGARVTMIGSDGLVRWEVDLDPLVGSEGAGVAVDSSGNVYVTGPRGVVYAFDPARGGASAARTADSAPVAPPIRPYTDPSADAFVAKLDASGNMLWHTFLGGAGNEWGHDIAVDASGNVSVAGESDASWETPIRPWAGTIDAFVARLDTNGNLVWNTFLGGTGHDAGTGLSPDAGGGLRVSGRSAGTWGAPIRPWAGSTDAFAAGLGSDGALLWSTFLGGAGEDVGNAIVVDASGDAYVTGRSAGTWGAPISPLAGSPGAFVAKLDAGGALTANTFRGSATAVGTAIAVDGDGRVLVTGDSTGTWGDPILPWTGASDAFVSMIGEFVGVAPTDIVLSDSGVAENLPVGTVVGALSAVDADSGDVFTYALASGAGDEDNTSFEIAGASLKTAAMFNFETKSSYGIRVRSTGSDGRWYEKVFAIAVTDVDEPPTTIILSNSSVAENQAAGAAVGTLSATDPDAGDTFTYSLVSWADNTHYESFTIVGNELRTAGVFDFESNSAYYIQVRVTDNAGFSLTRVFMVTVANVNEPPTTANSLRHSQVGLGQRFNATDFPFVDPDRGDALQKVQVATLPAVGVLFVDADQDWSIDPGEALAAGSEVAVETIRSDRFRFKGVGDWGSSIDTSFTFRVSDGQLYSEQAATMTLDSTPTDLSLSRNVLPDGLPQGTSVGTLSTTDADAGETFTYSLVSGVGDADNAWFTIVDSALKTDAMLDYTVRNPYSIRVRSTDAGGLWIEEVFTIVPPAYALWTRSDTGQAALWQLEPSSGALIGSSWLHSKSGVGAPWKATGYQHVNGTTGYVLWTRSDTGQAALWRVDPGTGKLDKAAYLYSRSGVGPPWQATSYQHVSATEGYVLWTRSDTGQAALWRVNPGGLDTLAVLPIESSAYLYSASGVGGPWQATSYDHVSSTEGYVLWTRSDTGQGAVWKVDPSAMPDVISISSGGGVYLHPASGVGRSWEASSFEHTSDREGHVLWTRSDTGQAALWKVNPGTGALIDARYLYSGSGIGRPWQATDYVRTSTSPAYALTVASTNPASGVEIAVTPADLGAEADGTSPFERSYSSGGTVTLTAPSTADGNTFASWTGCDTTDGASCTVTMNGARSVTASFTTPEITYELSVDTANPASGVAIAVTPADLGAEADGISPFQRSYSDGATVTLTAPSTADGNAFESWTGCDDADGTTCIVTMDGLRSVTASFTTPVVTYDLSVDTVNPASGVSIAVTPADLGAEEDGISPFQRTYSDGATVTVTAPSTADGNTFASWTGCDSTDGTSCTVTMSGPRSVAADYTTPVITYELSVETANPEDGVWVSVTPADLGARRGGYPPFQRSYVAGTVVTLYASSDAGASVFDSWSGCDFTTATTCRITMDAPRTVTAAYAAAPTPCESCHNLDAYDPGGGAAVAPNVMGNGVQSTGDPSHLTSTPFDDGTYGYNVNGHGRDADTSNESHGDPIAVKCVACHDISDPPGKHLDGTLDGRTPAPDNANPFHLVSGFIDSAPENEWSVQVTFDDYCWTACHQASGASNMRHTKDSTPAVNAMELGTHNSHSTPVNTPPPEMFYDANITWLGDFDGAPNYGLCVTCHNPHGTNVVSPRGDGNNKMMIYRWVSPSTLCQKCHP